MLDSGSILRSGAASGATQPGMYNSAFSPATQLSLSNLGSGSQITVNGISKSNSQSDMLCCVMSSLARVAIIYGILRAAKVKVSVKVLLILFVSEFLVSRAALAHMQR